MTSVGVVVPTRNGGERFVECLDGIAAQQPAPQAVVVIDSGSEDGTPERAKAAGCDVVSITPETFDHGVTRNQAAAALPPVDVIVFLVQDAVPLDDDCFRNLAEAVNRPGVAAGTARQVPPEDAGFLTQSTVSISPFADDEGFETGPFSSIELTALEPADWRDLLLLDDVCAAVRGDVFRRCGFRPTNHGEDALMAFDLLCAGWSLVHVPDAVVEHGHEYDPRSVFERYRVDARFFRERFGFRVRSGRLAALKGLVSELVRDVGWLLSYPEDREPRALRKAFSLRRAQLRGQLKGSRGPMGRPPDRREMPRPAELDGSAEDGSVEATAEADAAG